MTTWVKDQFRDSEHAQQALLRFALALGAVGFLIVVAASLMSR